jgi:leader peptidase (prepilin peptidase) / N-methyltransferase
VDLLVSDVRPALLSAAGLVFGALWGSFFNVAIYRWPRELSVVRPPSACPSCQKPIPARYNVPIFGYLLLRGRSACCGTALSPRYPIVEALSAVLCLAIVQRFMINGGEQLTLARGALIAVCYFFFVGGLLIATFVDLEFMEIPDEVSLPGAALGLVSAVFREQPGVEAAALGAGAGYLVIQVGFVWTYEHLTGRRGMGEGDSKLLLMIGAFVGWQGALFAVFAGAAQGLITYLVARFTGLSLPAPDEPDADGGENGLAADGGEAEPAEPDEPAPSYWGHLKLPFGPFLALGALEYLFFGDAAIGAWLRLIGA